jgi:polyhydroxyalkanoate synthesis regulator phasin
MTDATTAAKAVGMGIAGGAIVTALIDLFVAKGLIDREEARAVLESAMYRAAMYTGTFEGHEATKIIGALLESGIAGDDSTVQAQP